MTDSNNARAQAEVEEPTKKLLKTLDALQRLALKADDHFVDKHGRYTVVFKATKRQVEELHGFEWGSWEDHGAPQDEDCLYYLGVMEVQMRHPKEIAERAKDRFVLYSVNEAHALVWSLDNAADILHDQVGGEFNPGRGAALARLANNMRALERRIALAVEFANEIEPVKRRVF